MNDFVDAMARGAKKRALGIGQLGAEIAGQSDSDAYRLMQDLAEEYARQGEGTGVSGFVGEVLGDPLTYLAAPGAAAVTGLKGLAGLGLVAGGIEGGTRALKKGEKRQNAVMTSQAAGTVLSPAMGAGLKLVGRVGDKVINAAENASKPIARMARRATDALFAGGDDIALEVSGINTIDDAKAALSSLGDDAIKTLQDGYKSGMDAKTAYLVAKAKAKGIDLTRGQALQNPKLQFAEDAARMGNLTDDAAKVADQVFTKQQGAIRDAAGELLSNVTGAADSAVSVNATDVGADIANAVRSRAEQMKAPATAAYDAKTQAAIPVDVLQGFPQKVRRELRDRGVDVAAMPTLKKHLKTMNKTIGMLRSSGSDLKYQSAEVFKKRLYGSLQEATNNSERFALGKLHGDYVSLLDDVITKDLLKNPDEGAQILRTAPGLWREYKQTFFGQDGKAALGKIIDNDMTDKQVADLFGRGLAGDGNTQKVAAQLKNVFGADSPEMGEVRGMFLNRIFKGGLERLDDKQTTFGTAVKSNIQKFKTDNKALYDELYTPEMQKEIEDFADILWLASNQVRSKVNPSGSGVYVGNLANSMLSKMGRYGGTAANIAGEIAAQVQKGGQAKRAISSLTNATKDIGADTRIISEALRNIGAASAPKAGGDAFTSPAQESEPAPEMQNFKKVGRVDDLSSLTPATSPAIPADIARDEGLVLSAYDDTKGNRTVGYGFNMQSGIARKLWQRAGIQKSFDDVYKGNAGLTNAEAERLGVESLKVAAEDARAIYSDFEDLPDSKKAALVNLSYHHGLPALKSKQSFNRAVNNKQWTLAVKLLMNSDYGKEFPSRAKEISRQLLRNV